METINIETEMLKNESNSSEELLKGLRLPTIRRFPRYLRLLWELAADSRDVISSDKIAEVLNLDSITVRKDLAFTGIVGKPRIGYSIPLLIKGIEQIIKPKTQTNVVLVGVGSLGTALLGYAGFEKQGYSIVAAFDSDPVKIGTTVHNKTILGLDQIFEVKGITENDIGILCVPEKSAQEMANVLLDIGLKAIWNFTNTEIKVPNDITVLNEDLSSSLIVLSVNMKRNFIKANQTL